MSTHKIKQKVKTLLKSNAKGSEGTSEQLRLLFLSDLDTEEGMADNEMNETKM